MVGVETVEVHLDPAEHLSYTPTSQTLLVQGPLPAGSSVLTIAGSLPPQPTAIQATPQPMQTDNQVISTDSQTLQPVVVTGSGAV